MEERNKELVIWNWGANVLVSIEILCDVIMRDCCCSLFSAAVSCKPEHMITRAKKISRIAADF